ncbi:MAG: hypothetical protein HEEMFOPI_01909 [Holosporales bacterium]
MTMLNGMKMIFTKILILICMRNYKQEGVSTLMDLSSTL